MRVEEDLKQKQNENEKVATEVESQEDDNEVVCSTQEMIFDARARRTNKTNTFGCEKCEYKSGSKTILNKHIKNIHKEEKEEQSEKSNNRKDMRKRFTC